MEIKDFPSVGFAKTTCQSKLASPALTVFLSLPVAQKNKPTNFDQN